MTQIDDFDLSRFLPYLLNQAAEQTSRGFQQIYATRYDMSRTEWRILFHLGEYGDLTATEIAKRAMIHKTKISRAVGGLERKAMLARRPDSEDRRLEILALTEVGHNAFTHLKGEAMAYEAKLAQSFTTDELHRLKETLRGFTTPLGQL